ncbi:MAG: TonB-dependent receptor [Saprospiraceae bacterium]|nr:TonB-dependent receptor [Saprospiraceae bacterium]
MSFRFFLGLSFFLFCIYLSGQSVLTLVIKDANGKPIQGVTASSASLAFKISIDSGTIYWEPGPSRKDTVHLRHIAFQSTHVFIDAQPQTTIQVVLKEAIHELEGAQIISTWAKPRSIITHTTLDIRDIDSKNLGQDIPYILQSLPSTVSSSDAGNGIGYTGMRIRGLDPTQTNVLINGVPLNDAESQAVFWVDLPDLAASASEIQVQRGMGLSGAGQVAFGSSILINTNRFSTDPYLNLESTIGSFNTFKSSINAGTGLMKHHLSIQGRLSWLRSDGYIDRASAALLSGGLSISQISNKRSFRLHLFDGHEKTYQAWYGVPIQYVINGNRKFNSAGTERPGSPYENQVDDYRQTHIQFLHLEQLSNSWTLQNTLHFTPGSGYYEEYKADQIPAEYNLPGNDAKNLVRRRYLSNQFYGSIHYLEYKNKYKEIQLGTSWNHYAGRHFGRVVQINDKTLPGLENYYDQDASKWTSMVFAKAELGSKKGSLLADLQARVLSYKYSSEVSQNEQFNLVHHLFVSPKIGFTFNFDTNLQAYGFGGLAFREPNREDYVKADLNLPKPEQLQDYELGFRWNHKILTLEQNFYYMNYKNQLVPTGQLNDVGAYIRSNVPSSYRLGLETSWSFQLSQNFIINGNLNLSKNRTHQLIEYIDNWDTGVQQVRTHQDKPIAFSPSRVINLSSTIHLIKHDRATSGHILDLEPGFQSIGSQYLDGTGLPYSTLDGYNLVHSNLFYQLVKGSTPILDIRASVNNIFNTAYASNGWLYRFRSSAYNPINDDPYSEAEGENGWYHQKGLYPQAGRNFLISVRIYFNPRSKPVNN